MENPEPLREHRELEKLAGHFSGPERMHASRWNDAEKKGRAITDARVALDGFAVVQDYKQELDDGTHFAGHGVFRYDVMSDTYELHWFDSDGGPERVFRGGMADNMLVLTARAGDNWQRLTYDFHLKGGYRFKLETSGDGNAWQLALEGDNFLDGEAGPDPAAAKKSAGRKTAAKRATPDKAAKKAAAKKSGAKKTAAKKTAAGKKTASGRTVGKKASSAKTRVAKVEKSRRQGSASRKTGFFTNWREEVGNACARASSRKSPGHVAEKDRVAFPGRCPGSTLSFRILRAMLRAGNVSSNMGKAARIPCHTSAISKRGSRTATRALPCRTNDADAGLLPG